MKGKGLARDGEDLISQLPRSKGTWSAASFNTGQLDWIRLLVRDGQRGQSSRSAGFSIKTFDSCKKWLHTRPARLRRSILSSKTNGWRYHSWPCNLSMRKMLCFKLASAKLIIHTMRPDTGTGKPWLILIILLCIKF